MTFGPVILNWSPTAPELDRTMAQVPLAYFQMLFSMQGGGHNIVVNAADLNLVSVLQQQLQLQLNGMLHSTASSNEVPIVCPLNLNTP